MANSIHTEFKDLELIFEDDRIYFEIEDDGSYTYRTCYDEVGR